MQIHYLKKSILALSLLASALPVSAQLPGTHTLEVNGGLREYSGDLGSSIGFQRKPDYQGGGLSFGYYINPKVDGVFNFSFGDVGYARKWDEFPLPDYARYQSFRANTMDFTVGGRFKILSEESKFQPFIQAGFGGFYAFSQIIWGPDPYVQDQFDPALTHKPAVTDIGAAVQGGAGFTLYLTERLGLRVSSIYTYTMSDMWDGANNATPDPVHPPIHKLYRTNDMWGYHSIGFTYQIGEGVGVSSSGKPSGKFKDLDEDGVADKYDKCKGTLPQYRDHVDSLGCPVDTDGDGILDGDDKCPDVKGSSEFKGCPDSDGDGIEDRLDACPTKAGLAKFNGCPDTDGDGVSDKDDACPDKAGLASLKGCPDSDGDGVEDSKDKCPTVAGAVAGEGCPDTDGDGVYNNIDKCPDVKGTTTNKGCPEFKKETLDKIKLEAKGINFETGKDVIVPASFKNLNILVKLLNEYPTATVEIQGHTDNNGTPESNKTLSQKRAEAVKNYLAANGVNISRLVAIGYGQEMPLADNTTEAGKTKNRRVDFILKY